MNTALRTKNYQAADTDAAAALLTKAAGTIEAVATEQKEMKAKQSEILSRLQETEQKLARNDDGGGYAEPSSVAAHIKSMLATDNFAALRSRRIDRTERHEMPLSIKSMLSYDGSPNTAHGTYPTANQRIPGAHGFVLAPQRLLPLFPLIPQTSGGGFEFVRLSWTGDAGVQDGEGSVKPEANFGGTLVSRQISTIAVHQACSAQVLDDDELLLATLSGIMVSRCLAALESQIITGSGTGSNIEGIYTAASTVVTQQNATPDRIGYVLSEMTSEGYEPNVIAMHPRDWHALAIEKDGESRYLHGSPTAPAPPMLWNVPVVLSASVPQGTALCCDTMKADIRDRMAPTIFVSRDHEDFRVRNLVLILVELRAGLAIYDTAGFRRVSLAAQT